MQSDNQSCSPITFDLIILTDKYTTIDDVCTSLYWVNSKNFKTPNTVRLAVSNNIELVRSSIKSMGETLPDNINYYVDHTLLPFSDDDRTNKLKIIDYSANKCESNFYAIFNAGYCVPRHFWESIEKEWNVKKNRFCLLLPYNDNNGVVINKKFHNQVNGNIPSTLYQYDDGEMIGDDIIEKAKFLAEQTKVPTMIQEVADICKPPT